MKTIKIICIAMSMVLLITACGLFSAMAETGVATQPVVTQPVVTQPQNPVDTQPVTQEPTEAPTEYQEPTAAPVYTEPVVTDSYEPVTPRPTEYDEYNAPATYSDYENTADLFTPGNEQNPENEFEEIDEDEILDMALSGDNVEGLKDFNDIKENTSKGDEVSPLLLIVGLILVFLSIAGFTFVFMFNPNKKKKKAAKAASSVSGSASSSRGSRYSQNSHTRDRRSKSDYNDGF